MLLIRYILTSIALMILNISVVNAACEYSHSGIPNSLIRNYFLQMSNEYKALYPECSTTTCFRFHYDEQGCLRAVYFVPVSAAQTPQVFHIKTLYGEFDHLGFWQYRTESAVQGFGLVITFALTGYIFGILKSAITMRIRA